MSRNSILFCSKSNKFTLIIIINFVQIGIIITTCGFIFTWTPYAVALFVSAFRGKDYAVPPMVTFFCACFAKSSVLWIPMLYISTSTQFKIHFVNRDMFENQTALNKIDARLSPPAVIGMRKTDLTAFNQTDD